MQLLSSHLVGFYLVYFFDLILALRKKTGEWKHSAPEDTKDFGLLVSQKARKYAIAAELPTPVDPKVDSLVLQYDLRLQEGIECGGAYLKFLMPQVTLSV